MIEFETRVAALAITKKDEPLCSEYTTMVTIDDEGGGEFVEVKQSDSAAGKIRIEKNEWPSLRTAIDTLLEQCREC